MTYQEALETVVAQTGHERFRELCRDDHPDHQAWRAEMIRRAGGEAYPSLLTQVGNAIGAAGRFVASGGAMVDQAEQQRRLAICHECEFYDAQQIKCRKCGCKLNLKTRLQAWHCPISKW